MWIELNDKLLTDEISFEIIKIESKYGFQPFSLVESIIRLIDEVNLYKHRLSNKKYPRISNAKKNLKDIQKLAERLNELFSSASLVSHLIFYDQKQSAVFSALQNSLKDFCDTAPVIIDNVKDRGGRSSGSIPEFLICHLLAVFKSNTEYELQCLWNGIENVGEGKAYEFLMEMNDVFNKIDSKLYLGTEKSIFNMASRLISKHKRHDISFLSALLSRYQRNPC